MNSETWLHYFQHNRQNRPEPNWALPFPEDKSTAAELANSLAHFQLGESGEGACLLRAAARRYADDLAYQEALAMFIAEEKEHARLLARLVERFGGRLIRTHWTHSLFRLFRQALGARFEIQVLVTAELVGTAYYRVLARRVRDRITEEVCHLVLRDEARHVEFHLERFLADQQLWLPAERALWATQFQALFLAALEVAWIDHRRVLQKLGASRREFVDEARREAAASLARLMPVSVRAEARRPVEL